MSAQKESQEQPEPFAMSDEALERHRHRYREARRAGLTMRDSKLFASSQVDIEDMRALARRGCDPDLILRILL